MNLDELRKEPEFYLLQKILGSFKLFVQELSCQIKLQEAFLEDSMCDVICIKTKEGGVLRYNLSKRKVIQNKGSVYKKVRRVIKKHRADIFLYSAFRYEYFDKEIYIGDHKTTIKPFNVMDKEAIIVVDDEKIKIS